MARAVRVSIDFFMKMIENNSRLPLVARRGVVMACGALLAIVVWFISMAFFIMLLIGFVRSN